MHARALATGVRSRATSFAVRVGAAALLVATQPAAAQLCDGRAAPQSADGRVLGHLPYGEAAAYDLVDAPPGFGLRTCRVRREMLPDLQRLLAAAASDPTVGGMIYGLSCHRTLAQQQAVFCKEGRSDPANRAVSAAPPGHSEHSSGLAIDFAIRPRPANGCPDAEACMAALPAARWLRENAPRFGFEQSFPAANRQGVKWEPWHWRWVGRTAYVPGAARARFVFARARREFPAGPGIVDPPPVVRTIPDAPVAPAIVEDRKKRRKRRR